MGELEPTAIRVPTATVLQDDRMSEIREYGKIKDARCCEASVQSEQNLNN